jgi:hypothetical protein
VNTVFKKYFFDTKELGIVALRHISTSSMEQLNGTAQWNSSMGAAQCKIG